MLVDLSMKKSFITSGPELKLMKANLRIYPDTSYQLNDGGCKNTENKGILLCHCFKISCGDIHGAYQALPYMFLAFQVQ